MAKIRVHELAKKLNLSSKEVLAKLAKLGVEAKSHSSGIDEADAKKVLTALEKKKKPAEPKTKKKATQPKSAKAKTVKKVVKKEAKPSGKKAEPAKKAPLKQKIQKTAEAIKPSKKPVPEHLPEEREPLVAKKDEKGKVVSKIEQPGAKKETTEEHIGVAKTGVEQLLKDRGSLQAEEEDEEIKVPDRFKKTIDTEKLSKLKGKPGMQRAFDTIKRVDTEKKWFGFKPPHKKHGRKPHVQKSETKVAPLPTQPRKSVIKFHEGTTIKEFAELIGQKIPEVMKKFMELGYMPTINQPLDTDAAQIASDAFGVKIEIIRAESEETLLEEAEVDLAALSHRPPIVTIMGHVDHGKTTLLDAIRETKVTEMEAGGITQHIGAYKVTLKNKEIVFLDTPGHEAFTMMRARGAKVTDIVVLVVAADDSVMPQTIEAIDHAKAANVPIVVAINKTDKPEANITKVKNELAQHGVVCEDWGGQTIAVEVSAKKKTGIEHLLEMILLQSEVMELKADYTRAAKGTIIEAKMDKGKGPVGTVLVNSGTLKAGDPFLVGTITGRVRALVDDTGRKIDRATPSTPVEVIGFPDVPQAGEIFVVISDEKKARQIAMSRLQSQKTAEASQRRKLTLDDLYHKIKEGQIKELNIIIKADVRGSVEALKDAFESLSHPEVKVRVIHTSVGGINESDVMLAAASNAIIIGFNIRPDAKAHSLAEREGVDIRIYNIIYEAVEDTKKALEGLLEPTVKEKLLGRVEVRQTFQVSRIGTIAGCYVLDGMITRASSGIRVVRDNVVVYDGKIGSLKRFKEDVKEVQSGYECGVVIENFNDVKVGDTLEVYLMEEVATKLE
ncbi:translation initiation factor IF-2 [bacterium]|nr:MAG: translation initiation factor IF-2 [bacterium]